MLLLLASGCDQLLGTPDVHHGVCDPEARFGRAAQVDGLDSEFGEQSAQLSRDELTIVFSRTTIAGTADEPVSRHGDLYIAHREHPGDPFARIAPLDALNTELDEIGPSLLDDSTLYFARQDPVNRYRIFMSAVSGATGFGPATPLELGGAPNSDVQPYITRDALYYAERRIDGSASLFVAERSDRGFDPPRQLLSLEILPWLSAYEGPVVSSNRRTIYFSAPGLASPPDIWAASRPDLAQPFGTPHTLPELNTPSADYPTWISEDNCRLYLISNRDGRGARLYVASRLPP